MAQPYVGEIRVFAGNFAPAGWALCEGQLMPISENETLFQLIGTTYGGDGQSTFALPDMRGRIQVHQGNGYTLAESGGVEQVTLTVNQIPAHNHTLVTSSAPGHANRPTDGVPASSPNVDLYSTRPADVDMAAQAVAPTGGSQPHENMQPFLALHHIISLFGIFPNPT